MQLIAIRVEVDGLWQGEESTVQLWAKFAKGSKTCAKSQRGNRLEKNCFIRIRSVANRIWKAARSEVSRLLKDHSSFLFSTLCHLGRQSARKIDESAVNKHIYKRTRKWCKWLHISLALECLPTRLSTTIAPSRNIVIKHNEPWSSIPLKLFTMLSAEARPVTTSADPAGSPASS